MSTKKCRWYLLAFIILTFTLNGCATTLAPYYDKTLQDGLTTANTEIMRFLASVSGGTQRNSFDLREGNYANLVGRFDALEIQAKARPIPKNNITDKINDVLSKRGVPLPDDSETPSATAMTKISATLVKMRDTDQKQGMTSSEVQGFKNQIAIYLDQALTYENFLERL